MIIEEHMISNLIKDTNSKLVDRYIVFLAS